MSKEPDTELACNVFLSSDIAVGHCVILNDVEQPCGRLVAVIMSIEGNTAFCNYLCADRDLSSYNKQLGMAIQVEGGIHNMTPVSKFGVEVHYYPQVGTYGCERVGDSVATYRDGKPRRWQENVPVQYTARREVANVATSG
jgi:hypothetical protein